MILSPHRTVAKSPQHMTFSLTILGSNSATPTSERFSSAQVLRAGHEILLLDCAEGTQIQLRRNKVSMLKINHIFISHLHGDHFFGLIGLLTSLHLLGRRLPVHVYGPAALQSIIDIQLEVSQTTLLYSLEYHMIDPETETVIFENNFITITTIPLVHRIPTCGFLIREKDQPRRIRKDIDLKKLIPLEAFKELQAGADVISRSGEVIANKDVTLSGRPSRSYAYCTDTGYFEALADRVRGVDMLFHEATFMEQEISLARDKQHSTARDAARIAKAAGVKKLIIGHFSARYKDLSPLLEEAREIFPETELAEDGKTFILESKL